MPPVMLRDASVEGGVRPRFVAVAQRPKRVLELSPSRSLTPAAERRPVRHA